MTSASGVRALLASRNAAHAFVGVLVSVALCVDLGATAGSSAFLVSRALASLAALASLWLLLAGPSAEASPRQRLLALALLALGTRALDAVSGGWDVARASALALAATATAVWWEHRLRIGLRTAAALACLAGAAAALAPGGASLLLLPVVVIATDRNAGVLRRVGTIALAGAMAVGVAGLVSLGRGDTGLTCTREWAACDGAREWALAVGLFSSHAGLFYGSPLLWLGVAGWLLVVRREPRVALACASCWAAAAAMLLALPAQAPTLDAAVPTLALGLLPAVRALHGWTRRWPLLPIVVAGGGLVLWNSLLMAQYRGGIIPRDDTVAFARVTEGAAATITGVAGSPLGWPGNWIAAWRFDVPLERVDAVLGRPLFDTAAAPQATLALAAPRTSALLLEGWGSARLHLGRVARRVVSRAAILVPVDRCEPLQIVVVAAGPAAARVVVDGSSAATWALDGSFQERHVRVDAARWRCPVSTVAIEVVGGDGVWVEGLSFVRVPRGQS